MMSKKKTWSKPTIKPLSPDSEKVKKAKKKTRT